MSFSALPVDILQRILLAYHQLPNTDTKSQELIKQIMTINHVSKNLYALINHNQFFFNLRPFLSRNFSKFCIDDHLSNWKQTFIEAFQNWHGSITESSFEDLPNANVYQHYPYDHEEDKIRIYGLNTIRDSLFCNGVKQQELEPIDQFPLFHMNPNFKTNYKGSLFAYSNGCIALSYRTSTVTIIKDNLKHSLQIKGTPCQLALNDISLFVLVHNSNEFEMHVFNMDNIKGDPQIFPIPHGPEKIEKCEFQLLDQGFLFVTTSDASRQYTLISAFSFTGDEFKKAPKFYTSSSQYYNYAFNPEEKKLYFIDLKKKTSFIYEYSLLGDGRIHQIGSFEWDQFVDSIQIKYHFNKLFFVINSYCFYVFHLKNQTLQRCQINDQSHREPQIVIGMLKIYYIYCFFNNKKGHSLATRINTISFKKAYT